MPARQLAMAVKVINTGGVVAYPTESCFGLGCYPKNYHAIRRILRLKQRSSSKGLILIASDFSQLQPYIKPLSRELVTRMLVSWPGHVSWLLPAAGWVPKWLRGNSDKIAVRIPDHKLARTLCQYSGHALVSTSANRSRQQPYRHYLQCEKSYLNDGVFTIKAKCGQAVKPSTIIELKTGLVLR